MPFSVKLIQCVNLIWCEVGAVSPHWTAAAMTLLSLINPTHFGNTRFLCNNLVFQHAETETKKCNLRAARVATDLFGSTKIER